MPARSATQKVASRRSGRRPARPRFAERVLNCVESEDRDKDWGLETAIGARLLGARPRIPRSKDLRNDTWWTIGDQKRTGSCVGWAVVDSVVRWHLVQARRLDGGKKLSPRFVWMASKETDEFDTRPTTFIESAGTSLKAALDVARKFGVVPDAVLPFASGRLYTRDARTFYALAAQLKIGGYYNLGRKAADWRKWLATRGPIVTRLWVDATWNSASAANGGRLGAYQQATARGGHAVALVGYTPTTFIVRNSWGTRWGDSGYGHASLAYAGAAFTEAYGVSL